MKKLLLLSATFFLYFTNINAQWQQANCPFANKDRIECIAINGSTIFAGRYMGIFQSQDNGDTWTSTDLNAGYFYVNGFAFKGSHIFAALAGGGIQLSTNNGNSWAPVNKGLPANAAVKVLVADGNNIFAGVNNEGMFLSTDNGSNWVAINNGLTNLNIRTIAISGNNTFVGTIDGMFLSENFGTSWTRINNSLSGGTNCITISDSNIFAGTDQGIYLSTDNGSNWATMNKGLNDKRVHSLTISGTQVFAGTYGVGVFLSNDNGRNWVPMNDNYPSTVYSNTTVIEDAQAITSSGTNVFVGTLNKGIWKRSLSQMTGLANLNNKLDIAIYPNPASNSINIIGIANKTTIKVYDAIGQIVIETVELGNANIDISFLAQGIYIVTTENSKERSSHKVMVTR